MKIPCICLDDKNRPNEIPADKWPVKGEPYHITWIFKQLTQPGVKGVELAEFDISNCTPYNSYKMSRFGMSIEDLHLLIQMMKDTAEFNDINVEQFVDDLIQKEELILQE